MFTAVQPQAGADGCPAGDHEAPQLSLSVRRTAVKNAVKNTFA